LDGDKINPAWLSRQDSTEHAVYADEVRQAVASEVAKLPASAQEVVHLYYFDDMTLDEISQTMGRRRDYVRQVLLNAKLVLRSRLGYAL
jgi:RNA polymerase sigma factor (sigma-70 family)